MTESLSDALDAYEHLRATVEDYRRGRTIAARKAARAALEALGLTSHTVDARFVELAARIQQLDPTALTSEMHERLPAAGVDPDREAFPCPCCGYMTSDGPGSHTICFICRWQDDDLQLVFPDCPGGANQCSLIEAQRNFREYGACDREARPHVRPPKSEARDPEWRPLDVTRDRFLSYYNEADSNLWQQHKNRWALCLYYWRPNYWLATPS